MTARSELLALNEFGLTISMLSVCFSGSCKYTVTVGSQERRPGKLLLDISREEEASFHLIYLCIFTAYSLPGLQFCAPSHLLVLGVLSSLDN